MEVLYGEVGNVLRGVVEVDAVLLVAEEVAGPDISDKGSEVLPTSIILFVTEERSSFPAGDAPRVDKPCLPPLQPRWQRHI